MGNHQRASLSDFDSEPDPTAVITLTTGVEHPEAAHLSALRSTLDSMRTTMEMSDRDWSADADDAWLYGIVVGWDRSPRESARVAATHGWDDAAVEQLRELHAAADALTPNSIDNLVRSLARQLNGH